MPGCVPISWQLLLDKIEIKLKAQNFQTQKSLFFLLSVIVSRQYVFVDYDQMLDREMIQPS